MGDWLYNLARTRWYDTTGNKVAARVTRLVDACMHRDSQTGNHHDDGVEQLFHFMTEKLFPWLLLDTNSSGDGDRIRNDSHRIRDESDYAFTLATIVNMSVVWYLPLWFTVDLVTSSPGHGASPAQRSVSISSTNVVDIAQRVHLEVEAYKLYDAYVSLLLDVVFRGGEFAPEFRSFVRDRSAEVQHDVLGNLSSRYVASRVEPRFLQMRHLPALVPKLDARDWVDAMQSAFGANPPLTEGDTLFVTDSGLLGAVNVLFASYTARELTFHTAWWFVQVLSAVTSDTMHAFVMGNKVGDEVYPVMCGSHIATAYSVLLAGLDRGSGTASTNQRSLVTRLLSNVHQTAVGKVRTWTSALGSEAIVALSLRLGSTTTVVWPEGKKNESDGAWWGETLYGPDYDNATRGFFGHWAEIRRRLRASLNSDAYQSSLRVFRLQSSNVATYDAVSNAISVGVQAVTGPFYVADGTSAINYGGLGFLYALQVARTINTLTLLLDGDRTPSAWVPPRNATDASGAPGQPLWKLGRCPSSDASAHVTSLYPVLPALEIAHDAYRRFRNVAEDVPLRGLQAYSAEQVFFLTACHVTCWANSSGHRMSPECTDAMRNFAPFADAFSCPAGSPMNPHERCRFF
nr:neprilysin-like [Dermacentor andersoni]